MQALFGARAGLREAGHLLSKNATAPSQPGIRPRASRRSANPACRNFTLIASKRSRFPFDEDSPLAQTGVPETREKRLMGVLADAEMGQPSDIVSVLYGG